MTAADIALVNFCFPKDINIFAPPQGLLSINSFLFLNGIYSTIYDIAKDLNVSDFHSDKLVSYLYDIPEDIIGFSCWDSVLPHIIQATKYLKERFPHKTIILGGPSASNLQLKLLQYFKWIDFIISGEGELPLYLLISKLKTRKSVLFHELPSNIAGRDSGTIQLGQQPKAVLKADQIPKSDVSFIDVNKYNRWELSSSRGCPYNCEFCSVNSTLDNTIRFKNIGNIFDELKTLFKTTNTDCVNIVDDNFGLQKDRFQLFCKSFKSVFENKIWTCYFRLDDLLPDTVDLMVQAGCIGAFIGIEAGNTDKLRSIGKLMPVKEIISRLKYATTKMDITASFIWGFPDETEKQLLDSFNLIDKIASFDNILVDLYQLSPLSGTAIQRKLNGNISFDSNAISGFIYPPYLPKIEKSIIALVKEFPDIFSAFYHENSTLFWNKHQMVNKFLSKN